MKIHIKTYGCQMNERDSEALAGMLTEAGHVMVDSEEAADVLLFNTCSVREQAERKAKGKIGYMRKLKARKASRTDHRRDGLHGAAARERTAERAAAP